MKVKRVLLIPSGKFWYFIPPGSSLLTYAKLIWCILSIVKYLIWASNCDWILFVFSLRTKKTWLLNIHHGEPTLQPSCFWEKWLNSTNWIAFLLWRFPCVSWHIFYLIFQYDMWMSNIKFKFSNPHVYVWILSPPFSQCVQILPPPFRWWLISMTLPKSLPPSPQGK